MNKFYYDLHVHSCLSPCADDDMTPCNIARMAHIKGLDIVALTDHNSARNCPAFFHHCNALNITPIAGIELTTAEDIHLICLFRDLGSALSFDSYLSRHRLKIKNKPEIFGHQYILDINDQIVEEEDFLLPVASELSLERAYDLVLKYNGASFPAHIDRRANSLISTLGTYTNNPYFGFAEYSSISNVENYQAKYPLLDDVVPLTSSDAHHLWDINEKRDSNMLLLNSQKKDMYQTTNTLITHLLQDRRIK